MLLELAVGDAYGAAFEYAPLDLIRKHNTVSYYSKHPRHSLAPGYYTDDTQMSLAVTEAILSGERWSPRLLAHHFVQAFRRDSRKGYAAGFYKLLCELQDGDDLLARIRPDSDKSGASMRAAPLGVFPTIGEVIDKCRVQAAITHNTTDGINAACAAALMSHYFLYHLGPKERLGEFLQGQVPGAWAAPWQGKVGQKGWMSVRAAITAIMRNDCFSELLKDCINFTGDVDTVAAIAMAAASCSQEYVQDLPDNLRLTLENGTYGRDYVVELDRRLLQGFPR